MYIGTYDILAMSHAKYRQIEYPFLALSEEVGEVNGKIAKFLRKNPHSSMEEMPQYVLDEILLELGDVLWQLTACINEMGGTLESVAISNLTKLDGRAIRNTIIGEGDHR